MSRHAVYFHCRSVNAARNIQIFTFYPLMGLVTTLIFWGVEFGFSYLLVGNEMRYLGGAIGLTIGNAAKYFLDKPYVFGTENL